MEKSPELSLIVPFFNEEPNIPELLERTQSVLERWGGSWEILCVDDGSTDQSLAVLKTASAREPRIKVYRHRRNLGQSAAYASGFSAAQGEWLATMDGDLQNDPQDLLLLLSHRDEASVILGQRVKRNDPYLKRISSKVANAVRNRFTHENISDTNSPLKLLRREVAQELPLHFRGMHRFIPTCAKMAGFSVWEIPVSHHPRKAGVSKYNIRNRLFRALADLWAVRWMQKRYVPIEREVERVSR